MTGFFMRRPEDGVVLNLLRLPKDVVPRELQPRATAFERAVADGVAVARVGPRSFDGDGLTEYGLRGGAYRGADSVGERVAAVERAVRAGDRSLVYAYYGDLDATGHRSGCRVECLAARAHPRRQRGGTDRGHAAAGLPAGRDCRPRHARRGGGRPLGSATSPELDAGVEVLAGDPRAVHVHARPGAAADVLAAWTEVLGPNAWVVPREVAIDQGWFGPAFASQFRGRVGDVVAAIRTKVAVVDSRRLPPTILSLIGLHGSLTSAEQRCPADRHRHRRSTKMVTVAELVFFSGTMDCGKSTLALQMDHNHSRAGRAG